MNVKRLVGLLVFLAVFSVFPAFSQIPPQVEFFSPQNTVKNVRQVAVRFSEAMVPLGSPKVEAEVFDIDCPEKGVARWADERNWIYDFDRDLSAGVRCAFRVKAGLKTLAGRDFLHSPPADRRFANLFPTKAANISTTSRFLFSISTRRQPRTRCSPTRRSRSKG